MSKLMDNIEHHAHRDRVVDSWHPVEVTLRETQSPTRESYLRKRRLTLTVAVEYQTEDDAHSVKRAKEHAKEMLAEFMFSDVRAKTREIISAVYDGRDRQDIVERLQQLHGMLR